jgi:hypothetical protein
VPVGWKPRAAASPVRVAMIGSISIAFCEVRASTVAVSPGTGLPSATGSNQPGNGMVSVPTWPITRSSLLSASPCTFSSVGIARPLCWLASVRSAAILPIGIE